MEQDLRRRILEILGPLSTERRPVYMVGGAVRDLFLRRPTHDLDFAVAGRTRELAQEVARRLNAPLYVMDEERDTTRVVLEQPGHERVMLDFATLRAGDLDGDLRARDFTINALAVDAAEPDRLIDPLDGLADLRAKRIRACSPTSLTEDPLRVLRMVRQALGFHFSIDPAALAQARAAAPRLPAVSIERLRDELFRMLDGSQVHVAIRLLDRIGALEHILPELVGMKGVDQPAPHTLDVWEHTISVVQALEQLYAPLVGAYDDETVPDLTVGSAVLWLGRYRRQLEAHFAQQLVPDRSLRALLFLGALYHDAAKPQTRAVDAGGRVRFLDHPAEGQEMVSARGRALALSTAEIDRLVRLVEHHMRVHFLAGTLKPDGEDQPSRRAIYRYFQDTGPAGVDIVLLSLADLRGTYGFTLPQETWQVEMQAARALLEAYWEKKDEVVSPPRFLTGDDLMLEFALQPGRLIGELLASIREAQATGEVTSREQALEYARQRLERRPAPDGKPGQEGEA